MRRHRKMDPYLVSKQDWEIFYIARKFSVGNAVVRTIIKRVGRSRQKVYAALRKL